MHPFEPPSPQPVYFHTALQAWMVSRHADVLAALRNPGLQPEQGKRCATDPRAAASAALAGVATELRPALKSLAAEIAAQLPASGKADLLDQVIRPLTTGLALYVLRDSPARKRRLASVLHARFSGSGKLRRKLANAQFEVYFRKRPGDKSAVIGISETLSAFLANAWVALIRHPAELAQLRGDPSLIPAAMEELLRYAGLVHSLLRVASASVDLGGARIPPRDRVILKIASANHDPEQFPDPDNLDLKRLSGQVALGHGEHSCIGAAIVRIAATEATSLFLDCLGRAEIREDIQWRRGGTLVSAAAIPVILRPADSPSAISH